MKTLSDLSPAETLLLTTGACVPIKDLLKVTLMDLILKRYLKTVEITHTLGGEPGNVNTYVIIGDNFSYSKSLEHEKVFLRPYDQEEKREMLFSNLAKLAYNYAGSEKAYNKMVRDSDALSGCFTSGVSKFFAPFNLTAYGKRNSTELQRQLDTLSNTLPDLMQSDHQKAREIMQHIKGNIFLVKGIDFKRMAEIEQAVGEEVYSNYSSSNSTFASPITWMAFDLGHTFDSSCSGCSNADSSDWGDSSSGDSGCSGCGGGD